MKDLKEKEELSSMEKLRRKEKATNDDGTVNVEIHQWTETNNDAIKIEYFTPTNDYKSETMPFPKAGDNLEDYKFYRVLENQDLSLSNADLLEGKTVKSTGDSAWNLAVKPKEPPTYIKYLQQISKITHTQIISFIWSVTFLAMMIFIMVTFL